MNAPLHPCSVHRKHGQGYACRSIRATLAAICAQCSVSPDYAGAKLVHLFGIFRRSADYYSRENSLCCECGF